MTYATIDDLKADVIDRLGLTENLDLWDEEIADAIRQARTSRYEDIDDAELDLIMRAVWARVVGDDYPFSAL